MILSSLHRTIETARRAAVPATRLITAADVATVVRVVGLDAIMDVTIARLREALRSIPDAQVDVVPRNGFTSTGPARGLLEWMPIRVEDDAVVIKTVGYHPSNPRLHRLPTIIGTIALYDGCTGSLAAIVDGTLVTALRTGAASAIATSLLARPGVASVGLVGCGGQAVTQLHALSRVLSVERVLAFDIDASMARSLSSRARAIDLRIEAASRETIERECDIICTATSAPPGDPPALDGTQLKSWVHINAVGSDSAGKCELPRELLERSLVCPDYLPQALVEGECQQLPQDRIGPDLRTLVGAPDRFDAWRYRTTVFDSTGYALEDAVAMDVLLAYADQLGLGANARLEATGTDPFDPYGLPEDVIAAPLGT